MKRASTVLVAILAVAAGLQAAPAIAQRYTDGLTAYAPRQGWVTAESRWGNGRVSGPVRPGRHGPEVRLPGGTWVHCVRSCSETLRKESIDFWQSHGRDAPDGGPGYFHFEWRF